MNIYECALLLAHCKFGQDYNKAVSRKWRDRIRGLSQAGLWLWISKRFQEATGLTRLEDISTWHLLRFIAEERKLGLKNKTIHNHVSIVRRIWKFAHTLQLCPNPPPTLDMSSLIPVERTVPTAWSEEQLRAVLRVIDEKITSLVPPRYAFVGKACAKDWWRALVLFLWHTAVRISAALELAPSDVTLNCNTAIVFIRERKNQVMECREVTSLELVEAIKRIYDIKLPRLFFWPASRASLDRQARVIFEAALGPLPKGTCQLFHCIRRSAATAAARLYGPEAARSLLMHSSSRITERHYIDHKAIIRRPGPLPELTAKSCKEAQLLLFA